MEGFAERGINTEPIEDLVFEHEIQVARDICFDGEPRRNWIENPLFGHEMLEGDEQVSREPPLDGGDTEQGRKGGSATRDRVQLGRCEPLSYKRGELDPWNAVLGVRDRNRVELGNDSCRITAEKGCRLLDAHRASLIAEPAQVRPRHAARAGSHAHNLREP